MKRIDTEHFAPKQAGELEVGEWLLTPDNRDDYEVVSVEQHPALSRMLVVTTTNGRHNYGKGAQVWVRRY